MASGAFRNWYHQQPPLLPAVIPDLCPAPAVAADPGQARAACTGGGKGDLTPLLWAGPPAGGRCGCPPPGSPHPPPGSTQPQAAPRGSPGIAAQGQGGGSHGWGISRHLFVCSAESLLLPAPPPTFHPPPGQAAVAQSPQPPPPGSLQRHAAPPQSPGGSQPPFLSGSGSGDEGEPGTLRGAAPAPSEEGSRGSAVLCAVSRSAPRKPLPPAKAGGVGRGLPLSRAPAGKPRRRRPPAPRHSARPPRAPT